MNENAASHGAAQPSTHGAPTFSLGWSAAFILLALLLVPRSASAESFGVEGVTQAQPNVSPREFHGDLSALTISPLSLGSPKIYRRRLPGPPSTKLIAASQASPSSPQAIGAPLAPMPAPIRNFAGLSFSDSCTGGRCGAGWPPDPNGDVGPNHYVQAVNDAVAIYDKTGVLLASFTEDQLWSGAGTPCDGNSQGDPVVAYDWLADRFVLSWFAFGVDGLGNGTSPFYQCIAASKTSDPVAGGWWLYPIRMDPGTAGAPPVGDLNDYVKIGLWHDCLYLSANEFDAAGNYDGVAFGSVSRADLYNGLPLTYSLGWLPPSSNAFTMVPSNNQGSNQLGAAGAAQPPTPNYFVSESGSAFAFEVRKFAAGVNCGAGGTLSIPVNVSQAPYVFQQGAQVPQPNTANKLDMIDDRVMQKVQYSRISGAESLWVTHPVGTGSPKSGGKVAMQWAQIDVTGGTIATTPVQQQIYAPDATLYRFMGSVAADLQGNMALGYTTSNGTVPNFPSIAYSGRLVTDPPNTLPQSEVQIISGSGSQTNNCGGAPCDRWGDYSAMSLDPADSCTFWYVNEYYGSQANGNAGNWQTRIASFKFPSCGALMPTTTTIASSANPSELGGAITLTVTVTGHNPTGNVLITDGGAWIAGCAPMLGLVGTGDTRTTSCTTSVLTAGPHSLVAHYGGDGAINAASASAPLVQVVSTTPAFGSTTVLASAPNPSTVGASVTFTATISGSSPTGTVDFYGGQLGTSCFSMPLQGGGNVRTAHCVTNVLLAGSWGITSAYSGDGSNTPSSDTTTQVVNGGGASMNVALASAGAVASASSTFSASYPASAVNNGDRAGLNFGAGGVWKDATNGVFPDWVEIDFNGPKTIDQVIVYSVQDNTLAPVDPSDTLTFTKRGLTAFDVQAWNGSSWVTQGSITGNNLVKRTVSFAQTTTAKIRVLINGAKGSLKAGVYSYAAEIEAWTPGGSLPPAPGTTLSSSANPARASQSVAFTASVTGNGPSGTVVFTSAGKPIAGCTSVALSGSGNTKSAACVTSFSVNGSYLIAASYSGDANNPPSAGSLSEQIGRPK